MNAEVQPKEGISIPRSIFRDPHLAATEKIAFGYILRAGMKALAPDDLAREMRVNSGEIRRLYRTMKPPVG